MCCDLAICFGSVDEALADVRWRLHTSPDADDRLRAAISQLLHSTADGRLATPTQPAYHQILWWSPA